VKKMLINKTFFIGLVVFITTCCFFLKGTSQINFPIKIQNKLYAQLFEEWAKENNISTVFALQPIINTNKNFQSHVQKYFEIKLLEKRKTNSFLYNTFRQGNMVEYTSNKNTLSINPVFQFEIGKSLNYTIYQFNRGIRLDASINNKVFISTSFYENSSKFPGYINQYIDSLTVVPGMGKARYGSNNRIEYAMPTGYIGYKPNNNFLF
jgi:hypothetical protein